MAKKATTRKATTETSKATTERIALGELLSEKAPSVDFQFWSIGRAIRVTGSVNPDAVGSSEKE